MGRGQAGEAEKQMRIGGGQVTFNKGIEEAGVKITCTGRQRPFIVDGGGLRWRRSHQKQQRNLTDIGEQAQ